MFFFRWWRCFFAPRFYSKRRELEVFFETKVLKRLLYFPKMQCSSRSNMFRLIILLQSTIVLCLYYFRLTKLRKYFSVDHTLSVIFHMPVVTSIREFFLFWRSFIFYKIIIPKCFYLRKKCTLSNRFIFNISRRVKFLISRHNRSGIVILDMF